MMPVTTGLSRFGHRKRTIDDIAAALTREDHGLASPSCGLSRSGDRID
jgi:hypothetical protein